MTILGAWIGRPRGWPPLVTLDRPVETRAAAIAVARDPVRASLAWRQTIDEWLAGIGVQVYAAVECQLGLIGWEASGQVYARDLYGDPHPPRGFGYLIPRSGRLDYLPATR